MLGFNDHVEYPIDVDLHATAVVGLQFVFVQVVVLTISDSECVAPLAVAPTFFLGFAVLPFREPHGALPLFYLLLNSRADLLHRSQMIQKNILKIFSSYCTFL